MGVELEMGVDVELEMERNAQEQFGAFGFLHFRRFFFGSFFFRRMHLQIRWFFDGFATLFVA